MANEEPAPEASPRPGSTGIPGQGDIPGLAFPARPASPRALQRLRDTRYRLYWVRSFSIVFTAIALTLVIFLAVFTRPGQVVDAFTRYATFSGANLLLGVDRYVLSAVGMPSIAVALGVAALIALIRRRWALAARAVVIVGGANLTTQVLKHYIIDRPHLDVDYATANSLPSGHTTAAMAAAAALIIVVPHRWRTATVWFGAIFTSLMGASVMVNGWHRLADVIAAILVVTLWMLALTPAEERQSATSPGQKIAWAVGVLGTLSGVAGVAGIWWWLGQQGYLGVEIAGSVMEQMSMEMDFAKLLAAASMLLIIGLSFWALTTLDRHAR